MGVYLLSVELHDALWAHDRAGFSLMRSNSSSCAVLQVCSCLLTGRGILLADCSGWDSACNQHGPLQCQSQSSCGKLSGRPYCPGEWWACAVAGLRNVYVEDYPLPMFLIPLEVVAWVREAATSLLCVVFGVAGLVRPGLAWLCGDADGSVCL